MLRFLFRSAGFVSLALAFATLIVDGTRSLAAGRVLVFSVADTLGWLLPAAAAALDRGLAAPLPASLRDGVAALVSGPACLALAVLGTLMLVAGRRRPAVVGTLSRR